MKMDRDLDNILAACKNSLQQTPDDCSDITGSYVNSNNSSPYSASATTNIASFNCTDNKNFYRSASDVTNAVISSSSSSNAMSIYKTIKNNNPGVSNINSSATGNITTANSAYASAAGFNPSSGTTSTTTATTTSCSTMATNHSNSSVSGGGSLTITAARQRRASEYGYAQALLSQAPKIAAGTVGGASGSASDLDRASVLRLAQAFVTLQQGKSCSFVRVWHWLRAV